MNRGAVLVGMALALAACGGGSRPTGPTVAPTPQPIPQTLTVTSGETGAAVAGAHVNVGGQELRTDEGGHVTVSGGLAGSTLVDVLADGFFDRQTLLSRAAGNAPYALWPRTSPTGLDEHATAEIVYTSSGVSDPAFGQDSLHRWAPSRPPVEVVLQGPATDPAYEEFPPDALAIQAEAVATLNDALGGRLVLQPPVVREGAGGGDRVVIRIFPALEQCLNFNGGYAMWTAPTIRQATVTYCQPRSAVDLSLAQHELGHTLGLRHSSDIADFMFSGVRRAPRPSSRERLLLALMYQRPAGNRFPDNDRSATSARERTVGLRCP